MKLNHGVKQTSATDITCITTEDCLSKYTKGDWCKRGVACVKSFCHVIHAYPCALYRKCNSTTHLCDQMKCKHDKDCDDGKYCNGIEKCNQKTGQCMEPANPVYCVSGKECNETLRECVFTPIIISQWHDFQQGKDKKIIIGHDNHLLKPRLLSTTRMLYNPLHKSSQGLITNNNNNGQVFSVQDTTNSSGVQLNSTEVTVIVCMIVFVVGVLLMILFFAVFTRAGVHETIIVESQ